MLRTGELESRSGTWKRILWTTIRNGAATTRNGEARELASPMFITLDLGRAKESTTPFLATVGKPLANANRNGWRSQWKAPHARKSASSDGKRRESWQRAEAC